MIIWQIHCARLLARSDLLACVLAHYHYHCHCLHRLRSIASDRSGKLTDLWLWIWRWAVWERERESPIRFYAKARRGGTREQVIAGIKHTQSFHFVTVSQCALSAARIAWRMRATHIEQRRIYNRSTCAPLELSVVQLARYSSYQATYEIFALTGSTCRNRVFK